MLRRPRAIVEWAHRVLGLFAPVQCRVARYPASELATNADGPAIARWLHATEPESLGAGEEVGKWVRRIFFPDPVTWATAHRLRTRQPPGRALVQWALAQLEARHIQIDDAATLDVLRAAVWSHSDADDDDTVCGRGAGGGGGGDNGADDQGKVNDRKEQHTHQGAGSNTWVGELVRRLTPSQCVTRLDALLALAVDDDVRDRSAATDGYRRENDSIDLAEWTPRFEATKNYATHLMHRLSRDDDDGIRRDAFDRLFTLNRERRHMSAWLRRQWPREHDDYMRRHPHAAAFTVTVELERCTGAGLARVLLTHVDPSCVPEPTVMASAWSTYLATLVNFLCLSRVDVACWMVAHAHVALHHAMPRGTLVDVVRLFLYARFSAARAKCAAAFDSIPLVCRDADCRAPFCDILARIPRVTSVEH
jgi:hypothetical protein